MQYAAAAAVGKAVLFEYNNTLQGSNCMQQVAARPQWEKSLFRTA